MRRRCRNLAPLGVGSGDGGGRSSGSLANSEPPTANLRKRGSFALSQDGLCTRGRVLAPVVMRLGHDGDDILNLGLRDENQACWQRSSCRCAARSFSHDDGAGLIQSAISRRCTTPIQPGAASRFTARPVTTRCLREPATTAA